MAADPAATWFWPDMGCLIAEEVAAKRSDDALGVLKGGLPVELAAVTHL